jgi:hypothetical protein
MGSKQGVQNKIFHHMYFLEYVLMHKQIPQQYFRAAKVDIWQTRPPHLQPYHQHAGVHLMWIFKISLNICKGFQKLQLRPIT